MARPRIPVQVQNDVYYASAFSCAICQRRGGQIHHIDKDHSNNDFDNLVYLCSNDHDEAHTTRELSRSLTAARLTSLRDNWYREVERRRAIAATVTGQRKFGDSFFGGFAAWGYINTARISSMVLPHALEAFDPESIETLKDDLLIDKNGYLTPTRRASSNSYVRNTLYDEYDHLAAIRVHGYLSALVDLLVRNSDVFHITDDNWGIAELRRRAQPGCLIFVNRAQYFRQVDKSGIHRRVYAYAQRKKIRIAYEMNTRDMFGTTSITSSFSGRRSAAALLLVKSAAADEKSTVFHCSPIACGVGFLLSVDRFERHQSNN